MKKNIVLAHDLVFAYPAADGKKRENVLKEINLEIEEGCFAAILGHNGCGKSTLAKHFNCINLPLGGKVYIDGLDTAKEDNVFKIRSRAGMVFQNPDNQMVAALVEDEAAFAPENLGLPSDEIRRRVDYALKAVGMEKYAKKSAANLSGGQKQRLAVAGVLTMQPKLLILDEATAMLDPKGRKEVMAAIKNINKTQGTAIVHITHYMEEAAMAERVIVMDKGRIVLDGKPKEIFSRVEELREIGLDVPQITMTAYELANAGFDIDPGIISADELYDKIIALHRAGQKTEFV